MEKDKNQEIIKKLRERNQQLDDEIFLAIREAKQYSEDTQYKINQIRQRASLGTKNAKLLRLYDNLIHSYMKQATDYENEIDGYVVCMSKERDINARQITECEKNTEVEKDAE